MTGPPSPGGSASGVSLPNKEMEIASPVQGGSDPQSISRSKQENDSTENDNGMESLSRIATADYPHAFKLTFIVVALVLSIFLVALDMTIVATAIPESLMNSTASMTSAGTDPPSFSPLLLSSRHGGKHTSTSI